MSIAVFGLILMQISWLNNTIALKENQFAQNVNNALIQAVKKLEMQEAVFYISNKMISFNNDSDLILSSPQKCFKTNSLTNNAERKCTTNIEDRRVVDNNVVSVDGDKKDVINKNISTKIILRSGDSFKMQRLDHFITMNDTSMFNFNLSDQDFKKILDKKVTDKKTFIEDVVNELVRSNLKIEERVNNNELKKIIDESLKNNGIYTPFEYAVRCGDNNYMLQTKNFNINSSDFKYQCKLFPNDVYSEPDYLVLYFPNEKTYILQSLKTITLSSVILTLIIIIGFTFSLYTVFKQKKL